MVPKDKMEIPEEYKEWGYYLRQCRETAQLTQREVAAALSESLHEEFSAQRYNNYEIRNAQPNISVLRALTKILKVPADGLLNYNPAYNIEHYAYLLRNRANIKVSNTKNENLYSVQCPDGTQATLNYNQLRACTFLAKRETDKLLKKKVDNIFSFAVRMALWENIENKRMVNDEVPDIEMVDPLNVHSPEFNVRLAEFRKNRHYSQTEFAKKLNLNSTQTYNRYEKQHAQPSMHLLVKMAEQLQVSVNKLIDGYDPNPQEKALDFLKKINYDFELCKEKDCIILYKSHMNLHEEEGTTKNNSECFKLNGKALVYYLAKALGIVKSNLEKSFDELLSSIFSYFFRSLIQSGTLSDKLILNNKDTELYLYQQDFLLDNDYKTDPLWADFGTGELLPVFPEYIVDGIHVH